MTQVRISPPLTIGRHGPLLLVLAGPEVHGFVVDSWCKSYEPVACAALGLGKPDALPPASRRLICAGLYTRVKAVLERAHVIAAVAEEEPSVVLGYVVCEEAPPLVHFCYVAAPVRRQGVASALLEACKARDGGYTHHTQAGAPLARRFSLTYAPRPSESR